MSRREPTQPRALGGLSAVEITPRLRPEGWEESQPCKRGEHSGLRNSTCSGEGKKNRNEAVVSGVMGGMVAVVCTTDEVGEVASVIFSVQLG